ncbi:unnamed protein product [Mytilus edulis]|uniref:DDE Tnp4 domain-containing protein n=1 Tax=Mytilus edulis TaxID=6550 RepID=A0A8S3TC13_MYTED|nr:unnamed protein product [Mytilus edulis]
MFEQNGGQSNEKVVAHAILDDILDDDSTDDEGETEMSLLLYLVDYLKDVPELNTEGPGGIEAIPVDKKIMITLWYLGSLETINKIADRFGIGEASVIDCRNSVILSILKYLKHKFIRWPNQQEMQTEAQAFAQRNGFQDIVGAVNGTHIKINKPQIHAQRVVIIRAFALLKDRFSRLQFINTKSIELAVDIIVACCVLHNICIMQGDDIEDLLNEDDENDDGVQQPPAPMVENEAEGIIKRNLIARNLY